MSANKIGLNQIGEFKSKAFLAGDFPRSTEGIILLGGAKYPEGSVLGRITASGKCTLVDESASDGSQTIFGILAEEVDATDGDRAGVAYLSGEFALQRLTVAAGSSAANYAAAARDLGIYFKAVELQPED